jgi:hypothetical protein
VTYHTHLIGSHSCHVKLRLRMALVLFLRTRDTAATIPLKVATEDDDDDGDDNEAAAMNIIHHSTILGSTTFATTTKTDNDSNDDDAKERIEAIMWKHTLRCRTKKLTSQ